MAKRGQRSDAIDAIRDRLDGMETGCLSGNDPRDDHFRVYVMGGELLAAHGPYDGPSVVRRLVNNGALTESQGKKFTAQVLDGEPAEMVVAGQVPDELLVEVLHARFRQNILDFLEVMPVEFEPLDAVFVENLQVGHDSRALLDELISLRARTSVLRDKASIALAKPGPTVPSSQEEARLLDICDPQMLLDELLHLSPYEPAETLRLVLGMLEHGALDIENSGQVQDLGPDFADQATEEIDSPSASGDLAEETLDVFLDDVVDKKRRRREKRTDLTELAAQAEHDAPPAEQATDVVEQPAEPELDPNEWDDEASPTAQWEGDTVVDQAPPSPSVDALENEPTVEDTNDEPSDAEAFHASMADVPVDDLEMSMFADYDTSRGGDGDGAFTSQDHLLDRVELTPRLEASMPQQDDGAEEIIAVGEAEDLGDDAPSATVSLNFTGPEVAEEAMRNKFVVCNEVLIEVARAMDEHNGPGSGRACIQLLVDGTPSEFASLFTGIEVDLKGEMDVDRVIRNLGKRPQSEHRRLANRGVRDLIDRALSSTFEELGDEAVEQVMENVAGYEKRLGL